jgi:aldehyde dehydrogenase (NAD+)
MAPTFTYQFDHAAFKGEIEVPIGLFINNEWSESKDSNADTIE